MIHTTQDNEYRFRLLLRDGGLSDDIFPPFRKLIYRYFRCNGRALPWRENPTPYRVFISEIMLQQTQADRVARKFEEFIAAFPDFRSLAAASLKEVFEHWRGLGYNRRALALMKSAEIVCREHGGELPAGRDALIALPGVGAATASSIAAFAFNAPVVFIETNVRTVFIHFFFQGAERVPDGRILPLAERALDRKRPRDWYNALMDYGVMLKKKHGNPGRMSAGYRKQSPFRNSRRQVRGAVLRALAEAPLSSAKDCENMVGADESAVREVLAELRHEGFIVEERGKFRLS